MAHGGRRTVGVAAMLVLVGWPLLSACTGHDTGRVGIELDGFAEHGLGGGAVWLLAGLVANQASVYRVDPKTHRVDRVASDPLGITSLSASKAGVVLSDAITGREVPSAIVDGQVEPLRTGKPSLTSAYTPSIAPDGRIAFARVVYPDTQPAQGERRARDDAEPSLTEPEPDTRWEPVVEAGGTNDARIVIVDDNGKRHGRVEVPTIERVGGVDWSTQPGSPLAGSQAGGGDGALANPVTGRHVPLPKGWNPRCRDRAGTTRTGHRDRTSTGRSRQPVRVRLGSSEPLSYLSSTTPRSCSS